MEPAAEEVPLPEGAMQPPAEEVPLQAEAVADEVPLPQEVPDGLQPLPPGWRYIGDVPPMEIYRTRPHDADWDCVQWPVERGAPTEGDAAAGALCEPSRVALRSKHSNRTAYLIFTNNTPFVIRTLWINYNGEEVVYDILGPGEAGIQQTYVTHPWIARECHTTTQLVCNGQEAWCAHTPQPPPPPPVRRAAAAAEPAGARVVAPAAAAAAGPEAAGPADAAAAAAAAGAGGSAGAATQLQVWPAEVELLEDGWLVAETPYGHRQMHSSTIQYISVTALPQLAWSEAAHAHFAAPFKAAALTFLLCHQQLREAADEGGPDSPTHSGGTSCSTHLGDVPAALLPRIVGCAAPFCPQTRDLPLHLRPDIRPAVLPESPPTGPPPGVVMNFGPPEGEVDDFGWAAAAAAGPVGAAAAATAAAAAQAAAAQEEEVAQEEMDETEEESEWTEVSSGDEAAGEHQHQQEHEQAGAGPMADAAAAAVQPLALEDEAHAQAPASAAGMALNDAAAGEAPARQQR